MIAAAGAVLELPLPSVQAPLHSLCGRALVVIVEHVEPGRRRRSEPHTIFCTRCEGHATDGATADAFHSSHLRKDLVIWTHNDSTLVLRQEDKR